MKARRSNETNSAGSKQQRLLVAVDFSDSSVGALRHAVEMASRSKSSLLILHVVAANYGMLGIGREAMRDYDESQQRNAAEQLRVLIKTTVGRGIQANLEVRVGSPAEEIVVCRIRGKVRCDCALDAWPRRARSSSSGQRGGSGDSNGNASCVGRSAGCRPHRAEANSPGSSPIETFEKEGCGACRPSPKTLA